MITTKFNVRPHIAEYCYGKYSDCTNNPVRFPHRTEIYHTIWDLMIQRPVNAPVDSGNLEIILPNSRMEDENHFRKDPRVYNYISSRAAKIIELKIETFMFAEVHHLLMFNKMYYGITYKDTVFTFMNKYCIDSCTEDLFIKDFYRHREKLRRSTKRQKV